VFRDQDITPQDQIRFGGVFGRVTAGHAVLDTNREHPEILEIGDPVRKQMGNDERGPSPQSSAPCRSVAGR
jgi:hypothetical protein